MPEQQNPKPSPHGTRDKEIKMKSLEEILDLVGHFETAMDMEKNIPMKDFTNFYVGNLDDEEKRILAQYHELKKVIPGEMLRLMEEDPDE